jgi:hypothetical protein
MDFYGQFDYKDNLHITNDNHTEKASSLLNVLSKRL